MKYFGTDGIRGIYGERLTEELAFAVGGALADYFGCDCVLGMDTRDSSPALADALALGLTKKGQSVYFAGVIPSPAISYLSTRSAHPLGVMITASHNPPKYNGIKLFLGGGKLSQQDEEGIERGIDSGIECGGQHKKVFGMGKKILIPAREEYISYLINASKSTNSTTSPDHAANPTSLNRTAGNALWLGGVSVALDMGHGAATFVAREVFSALGASVKCFCDAPIGSKINVNCGALYPQRLADTLNDDNGFGFAFDGDADRVAFVYNGKVMDGDSVLYNLSNRPLKDNIVVTTLMSNSALERALKKDGKRLILTDVGDKNVYAALKQGDYNLGGEQSGHYIFYPEAHSGDGLLTALNLLRAGLSGPLTTLQLDPQKTVSLVVSRDPTNDPRVQSLLKKHAPQLTRLTVRMSGTEPKVRITAQAQTFDAVDSVISDFNDLILHIMGG